MTINHDDGWVGVEAFNVYDEIGKFFFSGAGNVLPFGLDNEALRHTTIWLG